ncbi:hypothetical protein DND90_10010 [Pseudomonas syringae pv. maculicola]|nr:hypothetical protein DND90_10010 [Pseudomonas syringae pv. maculicola]
MRTLQRRNALGDTPRHRSAPLIRDRTQSVQNGMRRRASHASQKLKPPQCPARHGWPSETGAYSRVRRASRESRTRTMMVAT